MSEDRRLQFLLRRLEEIQNLQFPGKRIKICDVGCASGDFIKMVRQNLADIEQVDGIDIPSKWFKSKPQAVEGGLYVQDLQQGVGTVPLGEYHLITLWEVLEHIENVYLFLRNLRLLMRPDSILLISTPNLLGLSRFIKKQNWIGIAEQDHKYLFDALTLKMTLTRAGFSNAEVEAFLLPSAGQYLDGMNKLISLVPVGGMLFAKAYKEVKR